MQLEEKGSILIFREGDHHFEISQSIDQDIWFCTSEPHLSMTFKSHTIDRGEWQTSEIFCGLLREIIGHSILEGENIFLPRDFIDLDQKMITWYSDNASQNVLKVRYDHQNEQIIISLDKNPRRPDYTANSVRIRTDGSDYGVYYRYFLKLYQNLLALAYQLKKENLVTPSYKEEIPKIRKMSLKD